MKLIISYLWYHWIYYLVTIVFSYLVTLCIYLTLLDYCNPVIITSIHLIDLSNILSIRDQLPRMYERIYLPLELPVVFRSLYWYSTFSYQLPYVLDLYTILYYTSYLITLGLNITLPLEPGIYILLSTLYIYPY